MPFSEDADVAEQQMHAIIFYLVTFGYIDGDFDAKERAFVREYIAKLVAARADAAMKGVAKGVRDEIVARYTGHFHEVFEGIDKNVKDLFTEAVAEGEAQDDFVRQKLKLRCFEIFKSFDAIGQDVLMKTIDELILADGHAHPAELKFRAELAALLDEHIAIELVEDDGADSKVAVNAIATMPQAFENHSFFDPTEAHYSRDPSRISAQVQEDLALLGRASRVYEEQRAKGSGRLDGKKSILDLPAGASFLDGHTYVHRPPAPTSGTPKVYDLTVLGDLHGCYSVLKATLMQSRFFDKVDAFRRDPANNPEPRLILLGDYIDRGLFSLNGVFRTVLQLLVTAPEFVYVLRGNHEYYVEVGGNIYGGVKPSEAINSLKPLLPIDVFRTYLRFFEGMPNVLLFDRLMFVHAGIPRDRLVKERWKDLASLNDPDMRFQMMWSDPSPADVIPADLQEKSARFPFGRLQAKAFLQRIGCHTLIRGHEKVESGFERAYDEEGCHLFTLFSSGGSDNGDLPADSSYRGVTPMALSIRVEIPSAQEAPVVSVTPWAPDYRTYNDPKRNAFFRVPPEIEHRA